MRRRPHPRVADRRPRLSGGEARGSKFLEPLEPRALLAAIAWDGEALDGDWHNPLNWVGDVVPGEGDDVTIEPGLGHPPRISSPDPVSIASLDLSTDLTVLSDFEVTDRTTIGDVTLYIGDAHLKTSNLTLAAGSTPVSNLGTWTISGDCTIARAIETSWSFLVADRASVSFLPGLDEDFGRIISSRGTVAFGAQTLVDGLGADHEHLRVVDLLSLGEGAIVQQAGIVVVGTNAGIWDQARLEGLGALGAALINVSLDLDWAGVAGVITISNSAVTARSSIYWTARSYIEGGTLHVRGGMSGENLRLRSLAITMGDDTIEGSASLGWRNLSVERSTITLLERSYIRGTLSDSIITGPFTVDVRTLAGCRINAGTTVIVSDDITDSPDARASHLNPLVGEDALRVYGRVIAAGGRVDWDGESIRLIGADSRLLISSTTTLVSPAGLIVGDGRVVANGTFHAASGTTQLHVDIDVSNTGTILATQRLQIFGDLNSSGTVEARGDVLTIAGDIAQVAEGTLTAGTWKAAHGGRLVFEGRSIWRNDATIIVEGDGVLDGLVDFRRNNGTILLLGAGDWIDGTLDPIDLVNDGTIRKEGRRTRNIIGNITQTKRGEIEVLSGRLLLEGSLDNNGLVRIGSPGSYSDPGGARLRITQDFNQRAAGVLSFIGVTGSTIPNYPRLIADSVTLRGTLHVGFDHQNWSGTPRDQVVTLINAAQPRVGEFAYASVSADPGTGILKYASNAVRVRLVP